MAWRRLLTSVVLVAVFGGTAAAQDVADLIGRPVVSVRFEVEGRANTSPTLADLSAVRVGQPLRVEDARLTMTRLDSLNLYDDIAVIGAAPPAGVDVLFRLTPRHPVTAIEIRGATGLSAGELRRQILQRYGGVPTSTPASAVEATAADFLRDEGYLSARVTSHTELVHEPEAATLVLDVEAGEQSLVRDVTVRGVAPLSTEEIVRQARAGVGRPYRPRDLESALAGIEENLRGQGYYEAQLSMQASAVSADGVDLVIAVDVGPRVDVRVVPAGALPGSLDELVPLRRFGSADQDLLEDSRSRIERALRADGYWRASAPFTSRIENDGALVVITFEIARGPRYYVERVELPQAQALPSSELRRLLDVDPGDVFDEDAFLAGLARVVDAYRRAGYYTVRAEPTYESSGEPTASRATVVLHPTITEGPAGRLSGVTVAVDEGATVAASDITGVMVSRIGQPYVEENAARDQAAIRTLYFDRGFPSADVTVEPSFANDGHDVALNVRVREGARVFIGQISVIGNERVTTRAILDEMGLTLGQPAGTTALEDARRRLAEMGVFRRITISMADRAPGDTSGHLIVNVAEAPATTIGIGGGLEGSRRTVNANDRLEFAPRGFFDITRRGLGGRNRSLSFFTRVSLKRDAPDPGEGGPGDDGRNFGFTEYRVAGTYQERRAFRTNTDLLIGVASEQARRTSFDFVRQRFNAEALRPLSRSVNLSGRYSLEFTELDILDDISEDDRPLIDRLFPQVRLSILSTGLSWDRRDNLVDPTRGTFITSDLEAAARSLGSEVGYVKGFFQASAFRRLDDAARTVLAMRGMAGVARGFERTVEVVDDRGDVVTEVVQDLPASQRFYAGGATTVRGFQLDRLGVEAILTPDGLSRGGNGILVLNVEIRRLVAQLFGRDLGVVAFVDGGNVWARARDVNLAQLRVAPGFGVRYDSPLGPLRLDFGFKAARETYANGRRENGWEYHLSIGEAF